MSQPEYLQIACCEGKVAFQSAKLAHEAAKRRTRIKEPRIAYRCRHCGNYHVGRKDKGAKK